VSTIEELLERKYNGFGLEIRNYGRVIKRWRLFVFVDVLCVIFLLVLCFCRDVYVVGGILVTCSLVGFVCTTTTPPTHTHSLSLTHTHAVYRILYVLNGSMQEEN
jgi:hypothetical protein